jgi:DNA-binding response OmpR family regulator
MKILVIEDDRQIAKIVEQLLANYNYAVDIAIEIKPHLPNETICGW